MTTPAAATDRPLIGTAERIALAYLTAMAVGVSALWTFGTPYDAAHTALTATATVPADRDAFLSEDSPRWSCLTDGNRLCGPFHGPTR